MDYRFRVYPTPEQEELINKTFGCVRFIYNWALETKSGAYRYNKERLSCYDLKNKLPSLKEENEWLKEVDSQALQIAIENLDNAYYHFFIRLKKGIKGKKLGFPQYKTKNKSKKSYTTNNTNNSIRIEEGKLKIPKVGLLNIVFHRHVKGIIKSVTISCTSSGKYYISIKTRIEEKEIKYVVNKDNVVGLDMSFSECSVASDGTRAKFTRFYRKSEKKLAKTNRRMHKRDKGSKNREKAKKKLAIAHEKVANQRKDFLNKLSYSISNKYDVVIVEDIDLSAMKKKGKRRKYGKSISDIGFGELRRQLEYKLLRKGKIFIKAPRFLASSQLCSSCGYKNKDVKDLSIREWECPKCNAKHDRDVNAGLNLVNWYKSTAAAAGIHAYGDKTSTSYHKLASPVSEVGKIAQQSLIDQAPTFRWG
ncbi:MAG: RNA-guided endonuclease TnpB family protein [Nanoarchaeota archaeon]